MAKSQGVCAFHPLREAVVWGGSLLRDMDESTRRRRRLDLMVRMALAARGLTRRELAARIGRDPSNLIGVRALPKIDVAKGLARVLGWPVDAVAEVLLLSDSGAGDPSDGGPPDASRGGADPDSAGLCGQGSDGGIGEGCDRRTEPGTGAGTRVGSGTGNGAGTGAGTGTGTGTGTGIGTGIGTGFGPGNGAGADTGFGTDPAGDGCPEGGCRRRPGRSGPGRDARRSAECVDDIAELLAEVAELQLAGWHAGAAQRLSEHLERSAATSVRLPLEDVVSVLAACRLWSGAPLEALALLAGATGCSMGSGRGADVVTADGPETARAGRAHGSNGRSQPLRCGRTAAASKGAGKELAAAAVEALALAELALHRLVCPGAARLAVGLARELCTPTSIRVAAPSLRAMGLRPQRLGPMLAGVDAALEAIEAGGGLDPAMARCREALINGPEPSLVRVAHEALAIGRWFCTGAMPGDDRSPGSRDARQPQRTAKSLRARLTAPDREVTDWAVHDRIGAAMPALRAIVDRLDDWPLRRRWFWLEHARRRAAQLEHGGEHGGLAPWVVRAADLEMVAGLIARYPDEASAAWEMLDTARLPSRECRTQPLAAGGGWSGVDRTGRRVEDRRPVGTTKAGRRSGITG